MMYGSDHPNEFSQIQRLKALYRGVVPEHVLEQFTDAILDHGKIPERPDDTPYNKQWYVGDDSHSHSLILARRSTVESLARSSVAKAWSKTWGQFLSLYGDDNFLEAERDYPRFRNYVEREFPRQPDASLDDLWQQYLALDCYVERFPVGDDEFDQADYEMWLYDRNSSDPDLCQMALEEVPAAILREYAVMESGGMMGGGDFAHIPRERRDDVVAAMTELGYTLLEDQELINAAQNAPHDVTAIYRRLLENEMLDGFIDQVGEVVDEVRRPKPKSSRDPFDEWEW